MSKTQLIFPETLLSSDRGEQNPSIIRFKIYDKNNTSADAEILLPVPIALTNAYSIQFDDLEAGLLAKSIQETISSFSKDQSLFDAFAESTEQNAAGALTALGAQFDTARRFSGFSFNKSGQLTINKPSNRSFSFRFNLVPKNENEAKTIQKIMDVLKYSMYPPVPSSGENFVYLNPARFTIDFLYNPGQKQNNKLFSSYFCFLTTMDIDQHAAGAPSYYADGYPQNRAFSLSFQEISPLNRQNLQDLEPPGDSGAGGGGAANIIQGTRAGFAISAQEADFSTIGQNITSIDGSRRGPRS